MERNCRVRLVGILVVAAVAITTGCVKHEQEKPGDAGADAGSSTAAVAPVRPKFKASEDDCVGPLRKAARARRLTIGDHRYELNGYLLRQLDRDKDEQITLGILSDSKENNEENRRNLRKALELFRANGVEAIIHLGDVATVLTLPEEEEIPPPQAQPGSEPSQAEISRHRRAVIAKARREAMSKSIDDIIEMLTVLAEGELPLLVIIGNRECKSTFNTALATLAEDYPNVINLNFVRRVDLDDVDIISQPGYHDPEYIHCQWDKCLYFESDTLALVDLAREATDTVLLVSHGPPRQKDRNGIDVVSEGANVGNPWLTAAIVKGNIKFGAFGNIEEAGGKATNLDGSSQVPQDTFVDSFYLNPGPADSMAWSMNDGTESHGMVAIVQVVGKKAKYRIIRLDQAAATPPPQKPASQPAAGNQ